MQRIAVNIYEIFKSPFSPKHGAKTLGDMVGLFLTSAFYIAGIVMLFLLIGGGIAMISGAGSDNPESVGKGKKAATAALIGFIIIISTYWVVRLIEEIIGYNFITDSGI